MVNPGGGLSDLTDTDHVCYTYKANTTSSARTRVASGVMREDIINASTVLQRLNKKGRNGPDQQFSHRTIKVECNMKNAIPREVLKANKIMFDKDCKASIGNYTMQIIDDYEDGKGYYLMDPRGVLVFFMHSRKECKRAFSKRQVVNTCYALGQLHGNKHVRNVKRSSSRTNEASISKYVCYGPKAARSKKGVHSTPCTFNHDGLTKKTIRKMAAKSEHLLYSELPSGYGNAIKKAKVVIGWETLRRHKLTEGEQSGIYAGLASAVDYSSPQHLDADAFLSTFQCHGRNRINSDGDNDSGGYLPDLPAAQYFVFAEFGLAFAFRPGDCFVFNPLYYHGCSAKTDAYKDEEVLVNAFYLKSMVVGRNDNDLPLDEIQKSWNDLMLKEQAGKLR
jgi:hypothetical protein